MIFKDSGWFIASHYPNDTSGFSATVFANGTDKVLAIRGTEIGGPIDTYQDLLATDLAEIGLLGLAASQAVALFNYVQRLSAPAGADNVLQLTLRKSDLPPSGTSFIDRGEFAAGRYVWLEASHSGEGLGILQPGDQLTVAGHSLGGHLAALTLRLFPDLFTEAFTFNAAGFDPPLTSGRLTDQFVGLFAEFLTARPAASFESVAHRIHSLQSESSAPGDDVEIVSAGLAGLPPSAETALATEKNSHSVDQIVDSLAVQSLLSRLNPALTLAQITQIYEAASREPGATDERIVDALSTLVLGDASPLPVGEAVSLTGEAPFDTRTALHQRILDIQKALEGRTGLTLQSLLDPRNADLVAKATADVAYRHALVTLQPFALTGEAAIHAPFGDAGQLDLFDPATRSGALTTAYLADRAHLLRQVLARNQADSIAAPAGPYAKETYLDGPTGLRFSTDASHLGTEPPADYARIAFDGHLPGTLTGGTADDRLYAGGGDDVLQGGGGSDYLEGGPGFDTYWWSPGDGVDRILDVDGNGRALLDGSPATGGRRVAEGVYRNTAGTLTYVWKPAEGTDAGPLVVNGVVRVEHFRNGDLGILLDDTPAAPKPTDFAQEGGELADALVLEDLEALHGGLSLTTSIRAAGGGGNDLLITVDGADRVDGGGGDDLILTGGEVDVVDAGDGNDQVFSGLGADVVDGGTGDDLLVGNQFMLYDTSGSAAEDQQAWEDLDGRFRWVNDGLDLTDDGFLKFAWHLELPTEPIEGTSRATGTPFRYDPASGELRYLDAQGAVVRTLAHQIRFGDWAGSDPKSYSGGTGNDLLAGADGDDALYGGADDDSLAGNGGDDVLVGGDGNDWLLGGAGNDYVDGGTGADSLAGEDGADALWGGDGNDRLFGDSDDRPLTAHGGDRLFGGAGDDAIVGHGGDDLLDGEDGADSLFGGPGRDRLAGGAGSDQLQGGDDADVLDGGSGNDILYGEAGDDTLIGGVGDDALVGGDGNDLLSGDAGRDLLDGGGDDDTYLFRQGDGFDRIEDAAGAVSLAFGPGVDLDDVTLQRLSDGSFVLGYGPTDAVQIAFGVGERVAEVRLSTGLPMGFDQLVASRLSTPVTASGTSAADRLQGGAGDDRLWGYDGDDWLAGNAGDDQLSGDGGADALYGGAGADELYGGLGDNLLAGGPGDDEVFGERGADTYLFALGDGRDQILDNGGAGTIDTLAFGEGVTPDDLRYRRQPNGDLLIAVGTGGDAVTVGGWFADPLRRIEHIAFADGQLFDTRFLDDLEVAPQTGTALDDRLTGTTYGDVILAGEGNDQVDGAGGDDLLDGGPGDDTYVLGLHSGFDTINDASGASTLALERGIWFSELTRERDGGDMVLRLRGSEQTGVRIAGYYDQPASWRVVTESGAVRTPEQIAEARYWGDAPDPVAQAKTDYLDALRADFFERMEDNGYTRRDADTVERVPVAATMASYRYDTRLTVTDYATGTVSLVEYQTESGPTLETIRYLGGDESATSRNDVAGQRLQFVVESVPLDGESIYAKRSFQQTLPKISGEIHFTPERTYVDYGEPESSLTWQTSTSSVPNGVSGIRLKNETTLTAATVTEGTLGAAGPLVFPYNIYQSTLIVERLTGDDDDNVLSTYRATHTLLEGGGGNDTLRSVGNWSWGTAGLFFDGGAGADRVTGGINGDRIAGGPDGDYLDGVSGSDHYLIDTSVRGFDLIDDSSSVSVSLENGWSAYKSWYYRSIGLDPSALQSQVFRGPSLPVIPKADATDYAAIAPFLASADLLVDEVELSGDVRPEDLVVTWGYDTQPGPYGVLRAVLNLSWGDDDSGVRITMPPPPLNLVSPQILTPWVQPDWLLVERGVGAGVERFRFGNGEVLTMAELLELAPPAPLHPQSVLKVQSGTSDADRLVAAAAGGWLRGAAGDDVLDGSASPDVLDGGAGNDQLHGGAGSDLYLFGAGGGHDRIVDAGGPGEIDVIKLTGLGTSSTSVLRSGNDLVLRFGTQGDALTISNWYSDPAARIEQVVFSDGWMWDRAELERRAVVENLAPTATDPAPVAVTEAEAFRIALPASTFVDPEGEIILQVTATLADGTALPYWLHFDATTLGFSGVAPLDASGVYQIALTAADSLGASAQAFLDLEVLDVNPPLTGQDAGETLVGSPYPDLIDGGRGDDRISGAGGDDVLVGGLGADVVDGGDGDDRLIYTADGTWLGERQSTNLGSPRSPAGGASVPFAGRGASRDVFIGGTGVDTLVGTDGADSILLDSGLGVARRPGEPRISGVERFELGGGDDLLNLTSRRHDYGDVVADGGDGDDVLWASAGNDWLSGGAGNDIVDGGVGDDTLLGGTGDDRIDGGGGDDLLVGGVGDDLLAGGRGGDTYRYAAGDGNDLISEQGPSKEVDRLVLEGDITADRLWFRQVDDDLVLNVIGTDGSVTIDGWYSDAGCRIEEIAAGDGRVLLAGDVDRLVAAMAVFDVSDTAGLSVPLGGLPVLAPVLAAAWQPAAA